MSGEELFEHLKKLTPEQRKFTVITSFWNSSPDCSGWEEQKEPYTLRVSYRRSWNKETQEILLLE